MYLHLLSLSSIITLALLILPNLIPYGNDNSIILIKNISLFSDIVSSIIGIEALEAAQVTPTGKTKSYILGGA